MRAAVPPSNPVPPRACVAGLPVTRAVSGVSACPTFHPCPPTYVRARAQACALSFIPSYTRRERVGQVGQQDEASNSKGLFVRLSSAASGQADSRQSRPLPR